MNEQVFGFYYAANSARGRINAGLLVLAALAIYGLRMLYRGVRGDIYDWLGEKNAPRWSYIAFGLFCQLPLIAFVIFLCYQGYFSASKP